MAPSCPAYTAHPSTAIMLCGEYMRKWEVRDPLRWQWKPLKILNELNYAFIMKNKEAFV